jgi:glycosyltransferase involved in cell wall biosynthesis
MRVSFVLPGRSAVPVGGYKIVYGYANHLAERGHEVSLVHPWDGSPPRGWRQRLRARRWIARYERRPADVAPWFEFDPRIAQSLITALDPAELPVADAHVATAWQTAASVATAARVGSARGYYLIQHVEAWDDTEEVLATWRLPLHKIVIAAWLGDIATELGEGERTSLVQNPVDLDRFGIDVPIEARAPRVGLLVSPYKNLEDAVTALQLARNRVPELAAVAYGTRDRSDRLPAWVEYQRLPDAAALRALYNSCSVFMQASRSEGWGLPATEAMACGCALVTYDNGGSREYAFDGRTAVVVPPGEAVRLGEAVARLAREEETRVRLARSGRELVGSLTWERATSALERVLSEAS